MTQNALCPLLYKKEECPVPAPVRVRVEPVSARMQLIGELVGKVRIKQVSRRDNQPLFTDESNLSNHSQDTYNDRQDTTNDQADQKASHDQTRASG